MWPLAVCLVVVFLVAGCKEEEKKAGAAPAAVPAAASAAAPASQADRVRQATEQNIREGRAYQVSFRGVQVYSQAAPQKMAVCGQVTPFQDSPDTFIPFVSVATVVPASADQAPQYQFEHRIGTTTMEAGRVYAALVTYCYDRGGPAPGGNRGASAPPPLPNAIPDPQAKPVAAASDATKAALAGKAGAAAKAQTTEAAPASGDMSMRQAGNLRSDPHGATVRVLPQGTPLHIFGRATGGWYQVGDTAPFGWVHESMLTRKEP